MKLKRHLCGQQNQSLYSGVYGKQIRTLTSPVSSSLSIVLEFERVNIDLLSIVVKQLCYEVPFIATFIILLFSTMSSQIC